MGPDTPIAGLLRRGYEEGRAAHGPLPLSLAEYARLAAERAERRLARCGIPATPSAVEEVLARAALADLFLAIACEEGVQGAWDVLDARYRRVIASLANRRGAKEREAEDVSREVLGDLYAPPPSGGARTRIGTYCGTGSLAAWLGVIVDRRLADLRRAAPPSAPGVDGEFPALAAAESREGDPADAAAETEAALRFAAALGAGWAALTDREALALRLRYREGLPQTAVARMLGVGEPRVSRLLRGAEARLRESIARALPARDGLAGDPDRLRRLLRDVVADLVATQGSSPDPERHEDLPLG